MLRLPKFEVLEPTSIDEAVGLLAEHGDRARPMAGGTDLLPNMKHRVEEPDVVVGLWRLPELVGVEEDERELRIGAMSTLHDLAHEPRILRWVPALAEALSAVAGPQLRRMGTIGGNVCLDTRCVYINQTHFWRQALGYCLKKDGTVCHVVAGGQRCVAAANNDSAPVLMSLGARLVLRSPRGERVVPIDAFYSTDGVFNQTRARDELLTRIDIPKPAHGTRMAYMKLRTRAAIDFPELGVAVLVRLDDSEHVEHVDVCVTALGARPIHVGKLAPLAVGRPLDRATIDAIADEAFRRCKPLKNIASDPSYRREMVPVLVRRALDRAMERGPVGKAVH